MKNKKALINVKKYNSAVINVDMQNGFLDSKYGLVEEGFDGDIVENVLKIHRHALNHGVTTVFSRSRIDGKENPVYRELWPIHYGDDGKPNFLFPGTGSHELHPKLVEAFDGTELIIDKLPYSVFNQSSLQAELQKRGIVNLFFTGVTTNVCVESSLRDAFDRSYKVFLISNGTKTFDENMQHATEVTTGLVFGYVISSDEFFQISF